MARTYKIRRFQNGKNSRNEPFYNYSLTVPTVHAEALPNGMQFACELLPEFTLPEHPDIPEEMQGRVMKGILFVPQDARPAPAKLPAWAQRKASNGSKPARRRPGKATA